MNQIIPDTDNLTVAKVAAALALVVGSPESKHMAENLDKRLERFKKAYKAVDETVGQGS